MFKENMKLKQEVVSYPGNHENSADGFPCGVVEFSFDTVNMS